MRIASLLILCAGIIASGHALAQSFPNRAVTTVVGFAPGGGTDTVARVVAGPLGALLGQQVIVDNKAGAGGTIAVDHVVKAAPDGYTLVLANVGALAVNPHMMSLQYDPLKDLTPITMATVFANVIVVQPALQVKTVRELLAAARQKQGGLTYASSGVGGAAHLAGELLRITGQAALVHVPYKGGGPAMAGFLGNQVDAFIATPVSALPHVQSGRAVAIATTGTKRAALMPDVPTVAEQGFPGYEALNWYAYFGPKGMPRELVSRLNREIHRVLQQPETIAALAKQGVEPQTSTPEELAKYVEREHQVWGKVVKEAGIKAQ